jgi:hypothetical protein
LGPFCRPFFAVRCYPVFVALLIAIKAKDCWDAIRFSKFPATKFAFSFTAGVLNFNKDKFVISTELPYPDSSTFSTSHSLLRSM